jgi:mannose-1-phosphate guanylyltransferase
MGHLWALVLAGGEGTRLSTFTFGLTGEPVPKQYCTFGSGEPMVRWAVRRASGVVPLSRILVVVAESHRRCWSRALADLPTENVIVQPSNRGTAAGILLPVLDVFLRRDRDASFLVLPADHHVALEDVLRRALLSAAWAVRRRDTPLVLLGAIPEDRDRDFGWIVPGAGSDSGRRPVLSFVEKPDPKTHREILRLGALRSTFAFAVQGRSLLHLYEDALPGLLRRLLPAVLDGSRPRAMEEVYEQLPTCDFSRLVLERCVEAVRVLTVPPCGWSDVGTPTRLLRLRNKGSFPPRFAPSTPGAVARPADSGETARRTRGPLSRLARLRHVEV